MDHNLFFIPILCEAARQVDPTAALTLAFERIRELGQMPGYEVGYSQWVRFLTEAAVAPDEAEKTAIAEVAILIAIAGLASDKPDDERSFTGSRGSKESSQDTRFLDVLKAIRAVGERSSALTLIIKRDRQLVGSRSLDPPDPTPVTGLRPGSYTLCLDTGWALWSGDITASELQWHNAFPDSPLTLAAASAESSPSPTRIIPVPVGRFVLVVYPGVETGSVCLGKRDEIP